MLTKRVFLGTKGQKIFFWLEHDPPEHPSGELFANDSFPAANGFGCRGAKFFSSSRCQVLTPIVLLCLLRMDPTGQIEVAIEESWANLAKKEEKW